MTQRTKHPSGYMTAPPPAPTRAVGSIGAVPVNGLIILVTLLITVLTGAGFGYV